MNFNHRTFLQRELRDGQAAVQRFLARACHGQPGGGCGEEPRGSPPPPDPAVAAAAAEAAEAARSGRVAGQLSAWEAKFFGRSDWETAHAAGGRFGGGPGSEGGAGVERSAAGEAQEGVRGGEGAGEQTARREGGGGQTCRPHHR